MQRKTLLKLIEHAPIPDAADIVNHFMEQLGGSKGVATELVTLYKMHDCPPTVKARIMDFMLTMMHRMQPAKDEDLGMLSEEDLADCLRKAVIDESGEGNLGVDLKKQLVKEINKELPNGAEKEARSESH